MTTYWEKLRDSRWQKKRLEVMSRADFKCQECGAGDKTLNVHHKIYRKGCNPWDYEHTELACLCEGCHEITSGCDSAISEIKAQAIPTSVIYGLLGGFYSVMDVVDDKHVNTLCENSHPHDFAIGFTAGLLSVLSFKDLKKVADFACGLAGDNSEPSMRLKCGNEFFGSDEYFNG